MINPAPRFKTPLWQKISLMLLGICLTVILLESGLRLSGGIILALQEHSNSLSARNSDAYRILCIGESTTQRQYPHFLEEILNQRSRGIKFSVIDKGLIGTNTSIILNNMESYLNAYKPDMIVAMMGVNDVKTPLPSETAASSRVIVFIRSLRTYKLAKLLWLHMTTKIQEVKSANQPMDNTVSLKNLNFTSQNPLPTEEALKKDIQTKPGDSGSYAELGWLYQSQGKFYLAEETFKKGIEANPEEPKCYFGLGWVYRIQDKLSLAEETFKKGIKANPRDTNCYAGLGSVYTSQGELSLAEETFKKGIEVNPEDDNCYVGLASVYKAQGKLSPAEQAFKKGIEVNPRNSACYFGLGSLYRSQGRLYLAEQTLKKCIEINPGNSKCYVELGWVYRYQYKPYLAEQAFKKGIEVNPKDVNFYIGLATLYANQDKLSLAEQTLKKGIEVNPKNDICYFPLSILYQYQGKLSLAEQTFKKGIEVNPKNDKGYVGLGWTYQVQGKLYLAEQTFKKGIEVNPKDTRCYGLLALVYEQKGQKDLAREYYNKASELRKKNFSRTAADNYHRLKEILDSRNVKLVCVQYPLRSLDSLKRIFEGDASGIIFVDNESSFKEAIEKEGYNAYFRDMFAGDFGHCTDKGNRLLAGNIASAILKEYPVNRH